jgi:UDP-N-acetylmuramoyl-tripeptide--D-alanyl-D-alanine ligase
LNNAIGLPLTLLRLRDTHRAAVIELGMNHRGETGELAPIAAPTIVVVNNAQREHQEFMRSVADVADEHADAVLALKTDGVAVINADDAYAQLWRDAAARVGAQVLAFGTGPGADVRGDVALRPDGSSIALSTPRGTAGLDLQVPGRPMAQNALAACAAALAAGAGADAIVTGLQAFRPVGGRLATMRATGGARVIDDSYNANPDSVRAAIDVLSHAPVPRWLVLGDMGEVGDQGPAFHREIGEYARGAGIQRLFTAGELAKQAASAFGSGAVQFDDVEALAEALPSQVPADATLLVKGSRFMRMERVVAALTGQAGGSH